MPDLFSNSRQLFERAQRSIAGGVNSGIRKMEQPVPLYFTHGHGSRLYDVDGHDYLDYQIGQGAILYGHAPAGQAAALAAQATRGLHWAAQSELEIEVAERLQRMIPGAERVRFNNSATEVVLSATRLARAHTGRRLILKFEGHYHGWADEGLVGFCPPPDKWGTDDEPTRLHPSQGVIPEVLDQFIVARWNDPDHLRRRVEQYRGQIAAIILEPVASKFDQEMYTGYKKSVNFEEARLLIESLKKCPMTACAEIRGTNLRLADILALQPGDIVPLTKRFDAVLDLAVDGIPRYQGYVALNVNQKRVFQLTSTKQEG